ncbi:MAG TPA: hypothetical protein VIU15_16865 [Streptomyces sp.]
MRQSIAHAISACLRTLLSHLLPGTGQRRKPHHPAPVPATPVIPVSPWSRPWTSPSKEEAAELFRLQRERRRAATLATMGVDYPYTYEGAPFGMEDFRASA